MHGLLAASQPYFSARAKVGGVGKDPFARACAYGWLARLLAGRLAGQYMYSELEIAISGVKSCQRSVYPVPFRVSYIGGLCFFRLQELDSHRPGIFCSWLHLQLHGPWSYASI